MDPKDFLINEIKIKHFENFNEQEKEGFKNFLRKKDPTSRNE